MAKKTNTQSEQLYGFPQPIVAAATVPVIAKRNPSTSDTGYPVGQPWINTTAGTFFALVTNSGGTATWLSLGGSLTPAVASLTTGVAATLSSLAGNTLTATGSNASITFTIAPKGSGGLTLASGDLTLTAGNVLFSTAGDGIEIKEGSNARMGQATLVLGTATVSNTTVTANTRIFISRATAGGTPGAFGELCVGTVTPSTSFVINALDSTDGVTVVTTDVSVVNWLLIEKL